MRQRYDTNAAEIFDDVARAHGSRRALLWSSDRTTTYDALDRLSNRLARLLVARGVRKRTTVCLCLEKRELTYAAIVAALKVGSPYFVVDPANPPARTGLMVDRCRPALAFVEPGTQASFDCPTMVVGDDGLQAELERQPDDRFEPAWSIDGSDPAYIMFTSGSTGAPKGVTISHANLVNFIAWSGHELDIRPDDVLTNVNPLFFDNSVFDVYASLFHGAALAPFDAAVMRDPRAIVSRIEALGCTIYFSVPSLLVYLQTMKLVNASTCPALTRMLFGGEGYPKPMLAKLFQAIGRRVALYNVYGPTECTCICSVHRIGERDVADMKGYAPLGRLIPNFSSVIVDGDGVAVEPGVTGELCLGGPCVGVGYYREPAQTARAFIQNPTHDDFVDRMYKTGDLVRVDPADGLMYFVGRADSQIKHQGYRIELGEIEHALAAIDGVDEAAAVYEPHGTSGRIVAVVGSSRALAAADVKRALAASIPRYMIPDRIVVVPALLKNANGKIDRKGIAAAVAAEGR